VNKQELCSCPQDGRMRTASGWLLCVSPAHRVEPGYAERGPVWHLDWRPEAPPAVEARK
jgi:hypothetical protein